MVPGSERLVISFLTFLQFAFYNKIIKFGFRDSELSAENRMQMKSLRGTTLSNNFSNSKNHLLLDFILKSDFKQKLTI